MQFLFSFYSTRTKIFDSTKHSKQRVPLGVQYLKLCKFLPGWFVFVRHDPHAVPRVSLDLYPETVHHLGLQHPDPQSQGQGQDLLGGAIGKLFIGWISNGERSYSLSTF